MLLPLGRFFGQCVSKFIGYVYTYSSYYQPKLILCINMLSTCISYLSCVGHLPFYLNSGSMAAFKSHVIYSDCLG